jgi:hypothetical protein
MPDETEAQETDESELIDSWETEEVLFELHKTEDGYQVLALNGPDTDDPDEEEPTVCLAWSKEELEAVIGLLKKIVERIEEDSE